jgi:pimeloyl-ACP methyl ester carboxylesterase
MKTLRVNGTDMPFIDIGRGPPLVAIHGSLGDFRSWSPVMGPLSRHHRLIVPSLRHFFPEHWDGKGSTYSIPQHTADVIAFLDGLGLGAVHLMGHSRGGHIAFRVAEQRPDLIQKLILAEPGGELDESLMSPGQPPSAERVESITAAARLIAAGDVDGGLEHFLDRIYGPGTWAKRPAASKQLRRDNAFTLIGQLNEQRRPFSRASAEAIRAPTLLIGGAETKGLLPVVLNALAAAIPGARKEMIPFASHNMFEQSPVRFSELVLEFLRA